jgi:hypothetical protein
MDAAEVAQIEARMPHHERAWKVKRVARILMAVFVVAALAGFLGPEPFSSVTRQLDGDIELKYERVARYHAPARLEFTTPPGDESLEVSISSVFLTQIELENVVPQPDEVKLDGERHTFVFKRTNSKEKSRICFAYRPESFGPNRFVLQIGGFSAVNIQQFILP